MGQLPDHFWVPLRSLGLRSNVDAYLTPSGSHNLLFRSSRE
jgi:hypothetical protein